VRRAAGLLLASLVASGCLQGLDGARILPSGPEPQTPDGWPATAGAADRGPLHLSLQPTRTQPGANVTFLVKLVVDRPVRVTLRGCPGDLVDAWIEANGTRAWLPDLAQPEAVGACALVPAVLEPGVHARLASWNGELAGWPAPRGTYVVHAGTGLVGEPLEVRAAVSVP